MRSFMRTVNLTLKKRLEPQLKHRVRIEAEGFAGEAGHLQSVGRRFMKVSGQYFVPESLNSIELLDLTPAVRGNPVTVRSTFRGTFHANLVRVGLDYGEFLITNRGAESWVLIPLNKIVSIEKA